MHVSVPNVSGQSLTGTDKKNKTIHKDYLTGDTHIFKDKVAVLTDDELNALSGLPFLNASNDGKNPPIIQIGTSPLKTDKNKLAYVRASNVVFKAEFHIPPKEQLLQLKVLKLQLKGVRIYDATPSTSTTASNQLLCILGSNICSGQKSDADKNLNATFWKKNPDGSD